MSEGNLRMPGVILPGGLGHQTDASDYGIGGYLYTIRDGKVRVVRSFSKALVGAE